MRETLTQWWDNLTDGLDSFGEWADHYKWKILLIGIMLLGFLSAIALAIPNPMEPQFESRQIDGMVLLKWDAPDGGAVLYEIQGRQFKGDWETFMYSAFPFMQIGIPPGVTSFRVRAWTKMGPGSWSTATEYFIFTRPPESEIPGPTIQPAILRT